MHDLNLTSSVLRGCYQLVFQLFSDELLAGANLNFISRKQRTPVTDELPPNRKGKNKIYCRYPFQWTTLFKTNNNFRHKTSVAGCKSFKSTSRYKEKIFSLFLCSLVPASSLPEMVNMDYASMAEIALKKRIESSRLHFILLWTSEKRNNTTSDCTRLPDMNYCPTNFAREEENALVLLISEQKNQNKGLCGSIQILGLLKGCRATPNILRIGSHFVRWVKANKRNTKCRFSC